MWTTIYAIPEEAEYTSQIAYEATQRNTDMYGYAR